MVSDNDTLNKYPDGSPSPVYLVTARCHDGRVESIEIAEWWYKGRFMQSVEESAKDHFYTSVFDKEKFKIISKRWVKNPVIMSFYNGLNYSPNNALSHK